MIQVASIGIAMAMLGCTSPPTVGLYGASPLSGNWIAAQRMTAQAIQALDEDPPDLNKAEDLLHRAIDADPAHGPAYLELGVVYEHLGNHDEAIRAFAWAKKLLPGRTRARDGLHRLLEASHSTGPNRANQSATSSCSGERTRDSDTGIVTSALTPEQAPQQHRSAPPDTTIERHLVDRP